MYLVPARHLGPDAETIRRIFSTGMEAIQLTRQLREAAAAVDIPLLDHVIIGRRGADPLGRGYYRFREAGLL